MRHVVNPEAVVSLTVRLRKLTLAHSLSLLEVAMVDITACIDAFASAVWNSVPEVALVDRARSCVKLTVPLALILKELAFVRLAIRSSVLSIGALALLESTLEERAIWESHFT